MTEYYVVVPLIYNLERAKEIKQQIEKCFPELIGITIQTNKMIKPTSR